MPLTCKSEPDPHAQTDFRDIIGQICNHGCHKSNVYWRSGKISIRSLHRPRNILQEPEQKPNVAAIPTTLATFEMAIMQKMRMLQSPVVMTTKLPIPMDAPVNPAKIRPMKEQPFITTS